VSNSLSKHFKDDCPNPFAPSEKTLNSSGPTVLFIILIPFILAKSGFHVTTEISGAVCQALIDDIALGN
jgi:hypothetical protein